MMISTEEFVKMHERDFYDELIITRDRLIREIRRYEKGKYDNEIMICPSPDVVYQCNLGYLTAICELMQKKYRETIFKKPEPFEPFI